MPRSSAEMSPASSRKIKKLSSKVRLASPEGRKIAQIGSLARWKMFPAILRWEGCQIPWAAFGQKRQITKALR